MLVVSLKGLVAKMNWLAVNRQSESDYDSARQSRRVGVDRNSRGRRSKDLDCAKKT
jgi:hypothetical protein